MIKSITNVNDSGLAQKSYDDAQKRFVIFHVLNYIMYTEALNAFDEVEEQRLMRHDVKRYRKMCESEWARYQKTARKSMTNDAWYLLQDLCMVAHASIEENIEVMRCSFYNYLQKINAKNPFVISRLCVSLKVADMILILWRTFFATYKRVCGLDFTTNFVYADMHIFVHYLKVISEILSRGNDCIDFSLDEKCVAAMAELENKIADDKFLDNAALTALNYSPKYKTLYENILKEDGKCNDS